MNAAALFFVTHGSSDRRSWLALQNLIAVARSQHNRNDLYIGGGCLEGQTHTLAEQLVQFATEAMQIQDIESQIIIGPLFLLEGVHVSEDVPKEVAIAQTKLPNKFQDKLTFRITPHLGTHSQIPSLLQQQFEKYSDRQNSDRQDEEKQARILIAHGSRRAGANQVVEDLASKSQAIAAYWGVEPKIETQIENLLSQNIYKINVLPYFLTEGVITEAIAKKLEPYRDRAQIKQLPVPLSNEQIINLSLKLSLKFI